MNNLDNSILFDLKKTYGEQKKTINKNLLPVVKLAMNAALQTYDTEIINIIKQLHKSRREIWKKQNEGRLKNHTKRQHMASRKDQV